MQRRPDPDIFRIRGCQSSAQFWRQRERVDPVPALLVVQKDRSTKQRHRATKQNSPLHHDDALRRTEKMNDPAKKASWWTRWIQGEPNALELEPLKRPTSISVKKDDSESENENDSLNDTSAAAAAAAKVSTPIQVHTEHAKDQSSWKEIFFPSDRPPEVQLLRIENLALPVCYLVVGMMQGLVRPLLNVYPLDLGATEAQQTSLSAVVTLPATAKILFGFVSDNFAIFGYRRKPYMLAGWLAASFILLVLVATADLSMAYSDGNVPIPPVNAPSLQWLSASFFLFGIGMWMADVMADSLVAQKARLEPESCRGSLQSTCYACRFFGLMVAAPVSTYLYSVHGPSSIVMLLLGVPLIMPPLIFVLDEERNYPVPSVTAQCGEIWKTVCSRSVWQPMAFIFIYNLFQIPNAAWKQFLKTVLHFDSAQLNTLLVASYILLYCGTMVYKYCFLTASWRRIYQLCMILNAVLSSLQLLLIRNMTLGLSPFLFALGDDAFAEFLAGVQFLPITIMMVSLCPPGSEGASYAMFTTCWNSAMLLAPALSTNMLNIWDVSKDALQDGELDGLFNLSILTTVIQTLPIVILFWLPRNRDELYALAQKPYSGSRIGGGLFLGILVASMSYTLGVSILNIFDPGWSGES